MALTRGYAMARHRFGQVNSLISAALDGTLLNKLTLVFYVFMKNKLFFCPEFA